MAIEFRHPLWFEGGDSEGFGVYSELGIGAVISDTVGRRDALHMRITAPFLIVRFGGMTVIKAMKFDKRMDKMDKRTRSSVIESFFLVHQPDKLFTLHILVFGLLI